MAPAGSGAPAGSVAPAGDNPGATTAGNNPFLLYFADQSVLNIDMEVEEPEASENPTQSFEIHNDIRRHKQLLTLIIYIILGLHCEH